ncbi:hypothetical protein C8Q76DRAFT_814513 [Earliella scabrosa]|nr:hypothetical protein C8Q76DRAFT_814513 [Earliella scabrosa]
MRLRAAVARSGFKWVALLLRLLFVYNTSAVTTTLLRSTTIACAQPHREIDDMASVLELFGPRSPTQCGTVRIQWSLGQPPYTLRITSSDFSETLQTLGVDAEAIDWTVNLPGGTQFGLILRDSTPLTVRTGPIAVLPGPDDSCLGSAMRSSSPPTETPTGTSGGSDSVSASMSASQTTDPGSAGPIDPSLSGTRDPSLSSGAIAGIAVGAAVGGIILAALAYVLWRRRRGRARRGGRMLDLNESTLPPASPPAMSKVEMMRQAQNQPLLGSSSGPSSSSSTTMAVAQYQSGVPSTDLHSATSLTARSFSAGGSGAPPIAAGLKSSGTISSAQGPSIKSGEIRPESSAVGGFGGSVQESDAGVRLAGGPPPIEVPGAVQEELESGGGGRLDNACSEKMTMFHHSLSRLSTPNATDSEASAIQFPVVVNSVELAIAQRTSEQEKAIFPVAIEQSAQCASGGVGDRKIGAE